MENIYVDYSNSSTSKLAVYVKDLENKDYQQINIRMRNSENWITVENLGNKSALAIFENLERMTAYEFEARYQINSVWVNIQPAIFYTLEYDEEPQSQRHPHRGGALSRRDSDVIS